MSVFGDQAASHFAPALVPSQYKCRSNVAGIGRGASAADIAVRLSGYGATPLALIFPPHFSAQKLRPAGRNRIWSRPLQLLSDALEDGAARPKQ